MGTAGDGICHAISQINLLKYDIWAPNAQNQDNIVFERQIMNEHVE